MQVVIGTTDSPLDRINRCWAIFLTDDHGDRGVRVFGPDTLDACIEAKPHIVGTFGLDLARGG